VQNLNIKYNFPITRGLVWLKIIYS
jgi:hypothetical protein